MDSPRDGELANYLAHVINIYRCRLLGEELSEEALALRGSGAKSVLRTAANEEGIKHLYCDPDKHERKKINDLQIDQWEIPESDIDNYYRAFSFDSGTDSIEADELRSYAFKEIYWLQTLIPHLNVGDALFMCGARHVTTFQKVLKDRGINSRVLTDDFCVFLADDFPRFRVYDPTIIGPLGICFTCYEPRSPEFAYCQRCGTVYSNIFVEERVEGFKCDKHLSSPAEAFCSMCSRPMCVSCFDAEAILFPLSGGSCNNCFDCIARSNKIKSSFAQQIKSNNNCVKHPDRGNFSSCAKCEAPNCQYCLYVHPNNKRSSEFLCLVCYRLATVGQSRDHWQSAAPTAAGAPYPKRTTKR